MPSVWLYSDPHFGQHSILTFKRDDDTPLRPWTTLKEMEEAMTTLWNETVKPNDKVYVLGDAAIPRPWALEIYGKLHGNKRLIKGNHDTGKLSYYTPYFTDVRAYHIMNRILLAHIPIHPMSLTPFRGQIHGHLHARKQQRLVRHRQMFYEDHYEDDPNYYNVSVEQTSFKPILFEEVDKFFPPAKPRPTGERQPD